MSVIKVDFVKKAVIRSRRTSTTIHWSEDGNGGFVTVDDESKGGQLLRVDFNTVTGVIQSNTGNPVWLPLALRTLSRFTEEGAGVFGKFSPKDYGEAMHLMNFGFVERDGFLVRDAEEEWPENMTEHLSRLATQVGCEY